MKSGLFFLFLNFISLYYILLYYIHIYIHTLKIDYVIIVYYRFCIFMTYESFAAFKICNLNMNKIDFTFLNLIKKKL